METKEAKRLLANILYPHFLQRLVTHLYIWKHNTQFSNSLFIFLPGFFSGRSLTHLDSKVITWSLDIWMGMGGAGQGGSGCVASSVRCMHTCDTSRVVRAFLAGGHLWQTTSVLIALLHDAAVLQESPSCITMASPAFKGHEWLQWQHAM